MTAGGQTYLYDGDGKRVEKASGSPPVASKLYWYGTEDSPVLETDAAGNELYRYFRFQGLLTTREEANDWVDHYGLDALGNVRWLYSYNGAWDISDYYPFGGERIWQSNSTNTRKFTGKERDSESGLDNFGARYDASSLGRFMSPDPVSSVGLPIDARDPQSWNAYSYVRNNPLNLTDPDGTVFCRPAGGGDPEGVTQVCDATDTEYVNGSKEQQAAYDQAGYAHFDCSCDTDADKAAWAERKGNVSNDYIGDALVFVATFAGLEGLFYPQLHPEQKDGVVIGKMADLNKPGALKPGERQLDLPDMGNPKDNWAQNSSRLREAMAEDKPIRDASAEPLVNGKPGNNSGFLRAERNLLENHGWKYDPGTQTWNPPPKP